VGRAGTNRGGVSEGRKKIGEGGQAQLNSPMGEEAKIMEGLQETLSYSWRTIYPKG